MAELYCVHFHNGRASSFNNKNKNCSSSVCLSFYCHKHRQTARPKPKGGGVAVRPLATGGGRFLVILANLQYNKTWCHKMSWHQKYARGVPLQVYTCSPVFYWTGPWWINIYNVLCTSHCVVFCNVPSLMGQVLGKVLLTSWEIN